MRPADHYAAGMNHRRTVPLAVLAAALFVPAVGCDPAPEADGGLTAAGRSVILRDLRGAFPLAEIARDVDPADGRAPAIAAALANAREVAAHRLRGADGNSVYLHPDGHREAVYDAAGELVRDGINDESYNYFHPSGDSLRHFTFDALPWLAFGNSPDDPTTPGERAGAFAADLAAGVDRAGRGADPPARPDLGVDGAGEAVAVLAAAADRGGVPDFFTAAPSAERTARFAAGLREVLGAAK